MTTRGQDIASVIKRQIEEFGAQLTMVDVGTVVEVGDGIARVHGLSGVAYNELVEFAGARVAPEGAGAWNPVFDVTPAALVDALVTERGVAEAPNRERIALLLTDGEDHGRDPSTLAGELKKSRVQLTAASIGSAQGALIPLYRPDGSLQGYKNDRAGNPVLTKANPEFVRALAEKAGGESFHLDDSGDAARVMDSLTGGESTASSRFWSVASVLALLALAALLAESAADRLPFPRSS